MSTAWSSHPTRYRAAAIDGRLVTPDTGELIRDEEPVLRALDVMLGVLRLCAVWLGLDAPQRGITWWTSTGTRSTSPG